MAKRMFLMLVVAAAMIGGLGYFKLRQVQAAVKSSTYTPPPEAITTVVARQETWPATLSVVGDGGCNPWRHSERRPARHGGSDQVRIGNVCPGRRRFSLS
jgi:hypothetical protein